MNQNDEEDGFAAVKQEDFEVQDEFDCCEDDDEVEEISESSTVRQELEPPLD